MSHDDRGRARISRAAARRSCGATRSGETQVRRKRQREIQEAGRILINVRSTGFSRKGLNLMLLALRTAWRSLKPAMKSNYKWFVVAMLWFVCFFNYADRQAIFSVFEPIKGEMGLSDA